MFPNFNFNQQNNNFGNFQMDMNNPNGMRMNMNMMNQNMNMRMFNNNNNNFNGMNRFNNNNGNNFINYNMNNQFNNNSNRMNNMNNNNNFMHNSAQNLKSKILSESLNEKDPYKIQMKIALGLNNNKSYENSVTGGNQPSFLRQSSAENPSLGDDNQINIIFKGMRGNKHIRQFNKTDTIKQMLVKFLESLGLKEYHLTKIYFLFNATNLLHVNQNLTIEKFGIKDKSNITMIDLNNIIGA